MLNTITLMGRLTKDPELKYTPGNTAVTSFTLAVDRDFADKQTGARQTDFIDCVAWRSTGEFVAKHFTKGQILAVSGRLQLRDWTDKDGNKRRSAEVLVSSAYFAGRKDGETSQRETRPAGRPIDIPGEFVDMDDDDGDLPW